MRVILASPPHFVLTGPTAAPAVLAGVLRRAGHDAIPFDVGRFCCEQLLRGEAIRRSAALASGSASPRQKAQWAVLAGSINHSVRALRSGCAFTNIEDYRYGAQLDVELALDLHARAAGGSDWSSVDFRGKYDRDDPYSLLAAVRGRGEEPFDAGVDAAVQIIAGERPDLVGISIVVPQQLYGGLRLGYRLRALGQGVRVVIGGPVLTKLRRAIPSLPELFDCTDYITLREGEATLLALVAELSAGNKEVELPDLLTRRRVTSHVESCGDNGVLSVSVKGAFDPASLARSRPSAGKAKFDLRQMPRPVFEDLCSGGYLSPRLLYPLSTTRNCYYDKCDFCSIGRSFDTGYREMSAAQIVDLMLAIAHDDPAAMFKDVSEAIPPRLLFETAKLLIDHGVDLPWEAYLRFETPFNDPNVAQQLRRAGLRVAHLGLETGSQELSDTMRKAVDLQIAESILRRFADAGIWVHLFLMAGHPGEREDDHRMTLDFLHRNGPWIHSIQSAGFQLELDSDLVKLEDKFGFKVKPRQEPSFSLHVELESLGTVPDSLTIQRRVSEIRQLAYSGDCGKTLQRSRHVWDGHKIIFACNSGRPWIASSADAPSTSAGELAAQSEIPLGPRLGRNAASQRHVGQLASSHFFKAERTL